MKSLLFIFSLLAFSSFEASETMASQEEAVTEFCISGSLGRCKQIPTGGGFRCYAQQTGGATDCRGSYHKNIGNHEQ